MVPPPDDHDCGWKAYAEAQTKKLEELSAKVAELEKRARGHKTEKRKGTHLPPPIPHENDPAASQRKRVARAAQREATLETEVVPIAVPKDACSCPRCGSTALRHVGLGKSSTIYDYVQPHFRKRVYIRETLACRCGAVVTAPAPPRVGDKTRYSSSFVAHLAVQKCADSNAQYRLEKSYRNIGIPISRSTMCDLFHRAARELLPLYDAATALVPQAPDVHADETSIRQQGLDRRAFLWDFVTPDVVLYRYAKTRSGDVPKEILGASQGRLVVDQHTGYNVVTTPGKRTRAGCLAHARRRIFEAKEHPEAAVALDIIGEIYKIERQAKHAAIVGTSEHLVLRRARSRPLFALLLRWAHVQRAFFEPRSLMGRAVRYLLRHHRAIGCFLRHASIPPDNNIAEAALRRVALGRKNFLFVGNEDAGRDLAVMYTLVASCEKHGINPIDYLTDVLIRVHHHPASAVVDLLPHRWKPPDSPSAAVAK